MSIMVWGHRGYQHHRFPERYPEGFGYQNGMKAFRSALGGQMGLETDVIQSADKTAYLTHDTLFLDVVKYELATHLDEKSQKILGGRFISNLHDDEAGQLYLKDGQKLSRLDELLAVMPEYPERILNLELKGPNTAPTALKAVEEAVAKGWLTRNQIVFSSFDLPALAKLRETVGDKYKIGALLSMKHQTKSLLFPGWPHGPQDTYYTPFDKPEEVLQLDVLKKMQPDYFHLERNSCTRDDIALIGKYYPKAKVSLWCVGENHPDDKDDFLNIIQDLAVTGKIHAVMTDFPEALQEHLIKRGLDVRLPPSAETLQRKQSFKP